MKTIEITKVVLRLNKKSLKKVDLVCKDKLLIEFFVRKKISIREKKALQTK